MFLFVVFAEVLNREECNEKIDWWSCGALFYYCVMGKKLFDRNSKHLVVREILNVDIPERLSRCYQAPSELKDLMRNMLIRDADKRYNSVAIKAHPFFRSVGNVSKGAVTKVFDPMSASKLKSVNPTTSAPLLPSPHPHFNGMASPTSPVSDLNNSNLNADINGTNEHGPTTHNLTSDDAGSGGNDGSPVTNNLASSQSRLRNRWSLASTYK